MGREFNFPKFQAGQPLLPQLTAERLNAIVDAIGRNRVEFGDNVTGQRTPGGTIVRAHASADGGGDVPDISFILSDATTFEGDPPEASNKVLVRDGKINGVFPSGMGSGDYTLDLDDPADSLIYAAVNFDATTLEVTSRTLGVSSSGGFPPSTLDTDSGFFATLLGFTYLDENGALVVLNTHVGDINFELVSGALNGAPALLPVARYATWIPFPV